MLLLVVVVTVVGRVWRFVGVLVVVVVVDNNVVVFVVLDDKDGDTDENTEGRLPTWL